MRLQFALFLLSQAVASSGAKWESIETKSPVSVQRDEVYRLLERLKANLGSEFEIQIDAAAAASSSSGHEARVRVTKTNEEAKVAVVANSGVAAAWGIHHYLKYYKVV